MHRTIDTVLFDLGSTLWERVDEPTWAPLAAEAQARAIALLDASEADATLGAVLHHQVEARIKMAHAATPEREPDYAAITLDTLRDLGITTAYRALGAAVYEALRVPCDLARDLYADALTTLATLQRRGLRLGIVTNRHYGGTAFIGELERIGLLAFFAPHHIANSADLGWRKPHPAIFQHALDGLGVDPTTTVMVGDRLEADILGARRLGMHTIWRPKPSRRTPVGDATRPLPDATIAALSDLLDLLSGPGRALSW